MRIEQHVGLSIAFAGILLAVFPSREMAFASLISGVLLDVDHILDFLWQSREKFTLQRFFQVVYRRENPRCYIVLHGWEWLCLFGFLVWAWGGNPWLLGLYLGWAQHMIADQLFNDAKWWSYFFFGRLKHRFEHLTAFPWPECSFDYSRNQSAFGKKGDV
jgi:hypothetical protein